MGLCYIVNLDQFCNFLLQELNILALNLKDNNFLLMLELKMYIIKYNDKVN